MMMTIQDGDGSGQANWYLWWSTKDIVDEDSKWEMTVGLAKNAPKDDCTVDVTPRRLQKLKSKPGQAFTWTNTALDGKSLGSGTETADKWGLLTIKQAIVTKAKNRIVIEKQ